MKQLNLDGIRKIQLNILKVVSDYCDENGLIYFLGYGTLLGAIRHKGYIPWDDDIDIIMPRDDYERFIKEFKINNYDVKSHYTDSNYYLTFAKVSYEKSRIIDKGPKYDKGINIDIFPIDVFPNSTKKINKLYKKIRLLKIILNIKNSNITSDRELYKNIILKIAKKLLIPVNYRRIIKKINEEAMSYRNIDNIGKMGYIVTSNGIKDIMDKSIFHKKIKVEFEGNLFYAPKKYHKYLTNIYGDYMKLPPKEDRKPHHDFKAFLK